MDEGTNRRPWWKPTVPRVIAVIGFAAAGLLFVTSALGARGTDLRAERQTDLSGLVKSQGTSNRQLAGRVADRRRSVDRLAERVGGAAGKGAQSAIDKLTPHVGLTPVHGPGLSVTLDDAPRSAWPSDADPDLLIVHQEDLQGVVNALWAGGAEAVSLQGQRLVSTSAVRCVGNSVVLHGVPYPPPYEIKAIGDIDGMNRALKESEGVQLFGSDAEKYRLGYSVQQADDLRVPAFDGSLELAYAEAKRDPSEVRTSR